MPHKAGHVFDQVRAGYHLRWPHLDGGVLGVVKDLQIIQFGAELEIAIDVPTADVERRLDTVVAHQHRQVKVGAQERSHRAGGDRVADDALLEPVFGEDAGRFVEVVFVAVFDTQVVDLLGDHALQQQIAVFAEVEDLGVGQGCGAVVRAMVRHINSTFPE